MIARRGMENQLQIGSGAKIYGFPPAAVPSTLNTGITAFWYMGEASGSRADSVGSNTLSDNNTVGQRAGAVGNAADFVAANDEYLDIMDNADVSLDGGDWAFSGWVLADVLPSSAAFLIQKRDISTIDSEIQFVWLNSSGKMRLDIFKNGTTPIISALSTVVPGTGAWTHFYIEWDDSTGTAGISVNNETLVTTTDGTFAGAIKATSTALTFGGWVNLASNRHDGGMQYVGLWNGRKLTTAERTEVYNAGTPLGYPF